MIAGHILRTVRGGGTLDLRELPGCLQMLVPEACPCGQPTYHRRLLSTTELRPNFLSGSPTQVASTSTQYGVLLTTWHKHEYQLATPTLV